MLQAEDVKEAAWGCDWVGIPVPFQRCLNFIIATANKDYTHCWEIRPGVKFDHDERMYLSFFKVIITMKPMYWNLACDEVVIKDGLKY
jgi:hypothetical protein